MLKLLKGIFKGLLLLLLACLLLQRFQVRLQLVELCLIHLVLLIFR